MSTNYAELPIEARPAGVKTLTIESEGLPPVIIQKAVPDELTFSYEDTAETRNSKLVGFERGMIRLQPFVGPKQF